MSRREHRVNLALKYHYLDNLSAEEIRDRFEREGVADLTTSTIRDYLNEKPKEAVLDAIDQEHAHVREQAAERFERLFQDARADEALAVEDQSITALVPVMQENSRDTPVEVHHWTELDVDDDAWPEWACERDTIIEFDDDAWRTIQPRDEFPAGAQHGWTPQYRKVVVGVRRDQPNRVGRSYARQEAAEHLREKADILGAYETDINLNTDLEGALLKSLKGAYEEDDE
jgi:hypothetical protein